MEIREGNQRIEHKLLEISQHQMLGLLGPKEIKLVFINLLTLKNSSYCVVFSPGSILFKTQGKMKLLFFISNQSKKITKTLKSIIRNFLDVYAAIHYMPRMES